MSGTNLDLLMENRALRCILEEAYNGLKWYRDTYPEADSQADDELYERIENALRGDEEG